MTEKNPDAGNAKRKFREALEKKSQRQHASAPGAVHDGSDKSHGASTPIEKGEFRRKTGGGGT